MITAHSSDVGMPPGRYQIATVLKGKINDGGVCWRSGRVSKAKPRPVRVMGSNRNLSKRWRNAVVEQMLADAAINDPDELQELWIR